MAWIEHNEEYRKKQQAKAKREKRKSIFYMVLAFILFIAFLLLNPMR